MYMRNIDGFFNKKGPIEHIVEVNIYYQEYKEIIDRYDWKSEVECNFGNDIACLL